MDIFIYGKRKLHQRRTIYLSCLWGNYMVMKLCQTYIFCTVISLGLSAAKYTVAVQLTNSVMSLRQLSLCAMQNLGHPWSKLV